MVDGWFIAVCTFVVLLGGFTYWAVPRGHKKVAAVVTFLLLTVTVFGGSFELLGSAKPIGLEFHDLTGSRIVAYTLIEGSAIYLWLDRNGEPMTIKLPWSTKQAQDLQDAFDQVGASGGVVKLAGPKIDGLPHAPDDGDIADVTPPAKLPDKS